MPSVLFVTPAHGRYELTRICLEQRRRACETLADLGVQAQTVVIADDENCDAADDTGCVVIERDNRWLGARFNDGHLHAVEHDYDFSLPIGSDSWIDPETVAAMVEPADRDVIRSSRWYTAIHHDGSKRVEVRIDTWFGCAVAIPMPLLALADGRPCADQIRRGCDTSTMKRLGAVVPSLRFDFVDRHPLEHVGFRSGKTQVTPYEKLLTRYRKTARELRWPLDDLRDVYPPDLVDRVGDYYASGRAKEA